MRHSCQIVRQPRQIFPVRPETCLCYCPICRGIFQLASGVTTLCSSATSADQKSHDCNYFNYRYLCLNNEQNLTNYNDGDYNYYSIYQKFVLVFLGLVACIIQCFCHVTVSIIVCALSCHLNILLE